VTRTELIDAIVANCEDWSCPGEGRCKHECPTEEDCKKCASELLKEYEDSLFSDDRK